MNIYLYMVAVVLAICGAAVTGAGIATASPIGILGAAMITAGSVLYGIDVGMRIQRRKC